jgi:hypothetical protein
VAIGTQLWNSGNEVIRYLRSVGVVTVIAVVNGCPVVIPSIHDPPVTVPAKGCWDWWFGVGVVAPFAPVGRHRCVRDFFEDDLHMARCAQCPANRVGEQGLPIGRVG